jgi:signal transduction histidine kinase
VKDHVPRILVVDDEPGMTEGCRRVLAAEGYEVETAGDGLAGFELFEKRGDFDVILVDLKMPRMGGLEFIERARAIDKDAVILVITAYATIDTAVEATKRGAYGYIPKPFTPDELLLPVRNGFEKRALAVEARQLRLEREKRLLEVAFERSKCGTIINCMTDGVIVVNRDRQIVLHNAAAVRAVQECATPALPISMDDVPICAELRSMVQEVLDKGDGPVVLSKEVSLGKSTYMVNASSVLEPGGEILGAVIVLRDITALKKLETAKSMFVTMVAHEVKNPLSAIEGYLSQILDGTIEDQETVRSTIGKAVARAEALRLMVSELMNLRAIEVQQFVLKRFPLDIKETVAQSIASLADKAEKCGIELCCEYESNSSPCRILGDNGALTSVFSNLIDNAIKYTPAPGKVVVKTSHDGFYVKVAVQDTGIGMTPEEKERVFEEFFRAKNEQTAMIPGTGLGLSLAKRLVELHNGRISVQSAPGKGSEFVVSLPALK